MHWIENLSENRLCIECLSFGRINTENVYHYVFVLAQEIFGVTAKLSSNRLGYYSYYLF